MLSPFLLQYLPDHKSIQAQVKEALMQQQTLTGVLVESWAWRHLLIYMRDSTLIAEAAKAVAQEPVQSKLKVAWVWSSILAKIEDGSIREEANKAVAQVCCSDKFWTAELWANSIRTFPSQEERNSVWYRILQDLQRTPTTSTLDLFRNS